MVAGNWAGRLLKDDGKKLIFAWLKKLENRAKKLFKACVHEL